MCQITVLLLTYIILLKYHGFSNEQLGYGPTSNDMNQGATVVMPHGPITRSRARKLQQALLLRVQAFLNSTREKKEDVQEVGTMHFNLVQVMHF